MDISIKTDDELSQEEADFIEDNLDRLCDAIIKASNKSEKDAAEFGETFCTIQISEFVDAIQECCTDWLNEEFGFEITRMVLSPNMPPENAMTDKYLSAQYLYDYTAEIATNLIDNFLIPAIAIEQLHKAWCKKH